MRAQARSGFGRLAILTVAGIALAGCNALSRLAEVGTEPTLTDIQNPVTRSNYRPVSMPMPAPISVARSPNSLWRPGARAFFKDLRASEVGDIVQVVIDIDDKAEIDNATVRSRANSEDAQTPALFGFEASLDQILPEAIDPTDLLELSSSSSSNGTGTIDRTESIEIKLAAVVSQVLPNGNLVIHGRQETRVNFEIRELQIAGVIRPQDITNINTVAFENIAEARVAYGGRGHISDIQQPRYGQQIIDIIFPF